MFKTLKMLWSVLPASSRSKILIYPWLSLIVSLTELGGIALLVPIAFVAADSENIQKSRYLSYLYRLSGASTHLEFLLRIGLILLLSLILRDLLNWIFVWLRLHVSQVVTVEMTAQLFENYLSQPYAWFLTRHASALKQNLLGRVMMVVQSLIEPASTLLSGFVFSVVLGAAIIFTEPGLTAIVLLLFATIGGGLVWFLRPSLERLSRIYRDAGNETFQLTDETLQGIKTIKFLSLELRVLESFHEAALRGSDAFLKYSLTKRLPSKALQALIIYSTLAVMYFEATKGTLQESLPKLSFLVLVVLRLLPVFEGVLRNLMTFHSQKAILEDLVRDLGLERGTVGSRTKVGFEPGDVQLELDSVGFRYPDKRVALSGLNLTLPTDKAVAIVGATGAGKSTLLDILTGLLAPTSGRIVVGGKEVTLFRSTWSESVGYVPQGKSLFCGSIARNIAFGQEGESYDMKRMSEVARISCIDDAISQLPNGFESILGEGGRGLSEGQSQRLAIARALYRRPRLLILDEATSHLDVRTEAIILSRLEPLKVNMGIIAVTHRLSTLQFFDHIIVMDRGTVVSHGHVDELARTCPVFRALREQLD